MTGLFLLLVFIIWLIILFWTVRLITKKFSQCWWGGWLRVLLLIGLLPLPLVDEIMAKPQFEQLCKENSTVQMDREKAKGKMVHLDFPLPQEYVQGTWIPIHIQHWRYVDVTTGEVVIGFNLLHATGGWLMRLLGVSEAKEPLIFKGYCEPGGNFDQYVLFKELGIKNMPHWQKK